MRPNEPSRGAPRQAWHPQAADDTLLMLVHELLDAHLDTLTLAQDAPHSPGWELHARYLRDLQRAGHAVLATIELETAAASPGLDDLRDDTAASGRTRPSAT